MLIIIKAEYPPPLSTLDVNREVKVLIPVFWNFFVPKNLISKFLELAFIQNDKKVLVIF